MPETGKLKVFLGMCPGVGKTYAMLQAAGELRRQGVDVVAGVIETHGRKDTQALLEGLEILPPQKLSYRNTELAEFDIDGLLARRPKIALIDELAHSNAPGSRHPKRWQDVAELLDAGIDVFTTVNIQHLESRADVVTAITKAPVRETVPDSFLDRADGIELVDLTPRDLQRRLEEGKVYLGERAGAAAANFFKESHLTALRQLALRYTAERVGVDLREFQVQRRSRATWRTSERLLVAVGPSPFSTALIRRTRAMAGALDAPWSAVAVTTDETLSREDQDRLTQNLSLARQLGAEAATVEATSLVEGLLSAARERGVTQIVIGKSPRHGWRDFFFRPPALRLLQRSGDIDVVAVEPGISSGRNQSVSRQQSSPANEAQRFGNLVKAAALAAALALVCYPWFGFLTAHDIAMLMLCGVILGALFLSRVGTVALAIFTGLAWNFLFTEPRFSITIASTSDVTMFLALLIASLSMGHLSNRLRRRGLAVARQQMHNTRLLEINTILTGAADTEDAVGRCLNAVSSLFNLPCAIQLRDDSNQQLQAPHPACSLPLDAKERGVALWAFENKQVAGSGTGTLPEAKALHLPLQGRSFAMGVLSVAPGENLLSLTDRDLLAAIAAQIGLGLERNHLLHAIHHAEFLERSDQLRRSLLDHVSHELRTPVSIIGSSLDAIDSGTPSASLLPEMRSAQKRLRRVVEQLVESARIESGSVQAKPEWCDLMEILESAREQAAAAIMGHPFTISVAEGTPALVWIDADLLTAALGNLLANAGNHTSEGTPIHLNASVNDRSELEIKVRDEGPGLENPAKVFDRFYRGENSRPGGLGLGLPIVRGLIRGLGGSSEARNTPGGGAEFILKIPVRTAEEIPEIP
jgi:two-component system, OmpR family, sensor histidine kinase KdpD